MVSIGEIYLNWFISFVIGIIIFALLIDLAKKSIRISEMSRINIILILAEIEILDIIHWLHLPSKYIEENPMITGWELFFNLLYPIIHPLEQISGLLWVFFFIILILLIIINWNTIKNILREIGIID